MNETKVINAGYTKGRESKYLWCTTPTMTANG